MLTEGWLDNRKLDQIGRCGESLYARTVGGPVAIERPTGPGTRWARTR